MIPDQMPNDLQHDWTAIWASEANALAVDREVAEAMERSLQVWAVNMAALFNALPAGTLDPPGRPGAQPPAGAAPVAAPFGQP